MTCADERFYLVSSQLGADSPFVIQKVQRNQALDSFSLVGIQVDVS